MYLTHSATQALENYDTRIIIKMNWLTNCLTQKVYHVINIMMFYGMIHFSVSDFMKVLNDFSNYWHQEMDDNIKTSQYPSMTKYSSEYTAGSDFKFPE